MTEWRSFVAAVRAAFDDMPPEVAAYLDTFEVESRANREARLAAWAELDPDEQDQICEIQARVNPQLCS